MHSRKDYLMPVILLLLAYSCSSSSTVTKSKVTETLPIEAASQKSGEEIEQTDLNEDKKADIFTVYLLKDNDKGKSGRILLRKEIDVNFDGKIDIVRFYDSVGNLTREEIDLDFDKRIDTISHYKDGKVYLSEHSSSFDGKMDIRKHFENDALILKEVDTNSDGKMDTFYYFLDGKLERIGYDKDGDGNPEMFDDNPTL